jgi:ABC-type branched-subunit amino acid transport system substrate-binding protein
VVLAAGLVSAQLAGARSSPSAQVVVQRGQPVQLALVLDSTGVGQPLEQGIHNAVQMAVEQHPSIRGFRVQINDYTGPCFDPANPTVDQRDANAAAANAVVANAQNVAVVGHEGSSPFGEPRPPATTALEIYQSHGIVAINGSTTAGYLPAAGPTVFDRTAVADPDFDAWYALVKALPSDQLWQQAYRAEFGVAPTDFADLYYDAASLLLRRLQSVSTIVKGNLVIDRAALAKAVRDTTDFRGVTCTVTLDPLTGNRVNDPAALRRCGRS